MSWNKPTQEIVQRTNKTNKGRVWILSGSLLVALGMAAFILFHISDTPSEIEKERVANRQIKEVAPQTNAVVHVVEEEEPEDPHKLSKKEKERGYYIDERGVKRNCEGLRIPVKNAKKTVLKGKTRRFKRQSDEYIAGVLEIAPGKQVLGFIPFGERFVQDFKNSLSEKIEILPEDDDYTKAVKESVIETREELKKRMEAGEDVGKIMRDTRAELQKLGLYRNDLQRQVQGFLRKEDVTAKDKADFIKAANMMLSEKGLEPIKEPNMLLRQLAIEEERTRK